MSNKRKSTKKGGHERRISVRAVRRDPPDLSKIARAVVALALAQAEADAQAEDVVDQLTAEKDQDGPNTAGPEGDDGR